MRKHGCGSPQINNEQSKTRRTIAARLLLYCLAVCCAGIVLFQAADAVFARLPIQTRAAHQERLMTRTAPESVELEGKMDINQATLEDLQKADGVGPALAQRICDLREERGGFRFLEELTDVSGIGEKRFEALSALFYCPTPAP